MIIAIAGALVLALEAPLLGRRLARLLSLRLRRTGLVWLALIDQILVISVLPDHDHAVLAVANVLSYVAAGAFVWCNRRLPGLVIVGIGGAMNLIAISANSGTMPASPAALRASRRRPAPGHFVNSGVVAHPKLQVLGDIFATPRWAPLHNVFSVGDVVIVVGVAILIYATCTRPAASSAEGVDTDGAIDAPSTLDLAATH